MAEYAGEKTFEPTPHRRQQAAQEGFFPRSDELVSAAAALVGLLALLALGGSIIGFLAGIIQRQLGGAAWLRADTSFATAEGSRLLVELGRTLLPFFGLLLLGAVAVNVGQTGLRFLPSRIGLDPRRIDPAANLGRLFSGANLARLALGVVKLGLLLAVAAACLYAEAARLLNLTALELPQMAVGLGQVVLWTCLKLAGVLVGVGVADYAYQRWRHERSLRMTPQEVREEIRNLEGDPQVAARRRGLQRQMTLTRLLREAEKATAVVVRPGVAVAVYWDGQSAEAPRTVAKASGDIALEMARHAQRHGVRVIENPALADALYRTAVLKAPIPPEQHAAMAAELARG